MGITELKIGDMYCSSCSRFVELHLNAVAGVVAVEINSIISTATVHHAPSVPAEALLAAVAAAGYDAYVDC